MIKTSSGAIGRGTLIGFIAGVLPGAGASLGSFLAYVAEKKVAGKTGEFGKGDARGVAAPEAGNNAAAGGALVPMLALGVPGSGTTAVLLAILMSLDITPGPLLFTKNPDVVWGLIAALFIGNIMLLVLNIPLVSIFARVLDIPTHYLMPGVLLISFLGIYGLSGSTFDLYLLIFFGVLGWVLRKLEIPLVPVILGILLGVQMERNLRRALTISDGDWSVFWSTPLSAGLLIAAIIGFVFPIIWGRLIRNRLRLNED
jgi:putative tricarboxylic transport membrane protein